MKCQICNHEIPQGKKFCPGCGRVVKATDLTKSANSSVSNVSSDTIVYKPASSGKMNTPEKTMHIPDIFNSDPNAPEYTTPHAYDRATADVLQYDRMFVSKNSDTYERKNSNTTSYYTEQEYNENKQNYSIEPEYENSNDREYVSQESKTVSIKPRLNIKIIFISVAVIIGIAIIVTGIYQIGKQIGFWSADEPSSATAQENGTQGEIASIVNEPDSNDQQTDGNVIGLYTVETEQNTIFIYKTATSDKIIATIPTYTVIEITEIKDDKGKTTYGTYTGWVLMSELEYTPDATLDETETETETQAETTTQSEETTKEETTKEETTTQAETTTQNNNDENADNNASLPATYTVTLSNDGTYVNVRSQNSIDSDIISTLNDGASVTVDKIENGWGHIISSNGTEGWVYMVYLK